MKDELENQIQIKSLEPPNVLEDCNPDGTNNFDTLCLHIEVPFSIKTYILKNIIYNIRK